MSILPGADKAWHRTEVLTKSFKSCPTFIDYVKWECVYRSFSLTFNPKNIWNHVLQKRRLQYNLKITQRTDECPSFHPILTIFQNNAFPTSGNKFSACNTWEDTYRLDLTMANIKSSTFIIELKFVSSAWIL